MTKPTDEQPSKTEEASEASKEAILPPQIDIREKGATVAGNQQVLDSRLFMQLLVFEAKNASKASRCLNSLVSLTQDVGIPSVIYQDVNNPSGLGLLTWSEDPSQIVKRIGNILQSESLKDLRTRPNWTMFGRTYSSGYEQDLEYWILHRSKETVLNPQTPWAVWYPLRRKGEFAALPGREQGGILKEHALIGRTYGEAGLAHDVRLACHGLDANDNDFVIGLIGKDLHPLSHVVQRMRSTQQTSQYMAQMGPFFVGYVVAQNAGNA